MKLSYSKFLRNCFGGKRLYIYERKIFITVNPTHMHSTHAWSSGTMLHYEQIANTVTQIFTHFLTIKKFTYKLHFFSEYVTLLRRYSRNMCTVCIFVQNFFRLEKQNKKQLAEEINNLREVWTLGNNCGQLVVVDYVTTLSV